MTNLRDLTVSLTKHGAHKVATLLKKYAAADVVAHLANSEPGINIEEAQAKKTLGVKDGGAVPEVWDKAKSAGSETIDALTLVAVISSHHQLIAAMKGSVNRKPYCGTIKRGKDIDGKAFTNFAHIIEELGFSASHSPDHVAYDLHKLFEIEGLNRLVTELFSIRLGSAGWNKKTPIIDELTALRMHNVFSITESQLRAWLSTGTLQPGLLVEASEDARFFFDADDTPSSGQFEFKPGHTKKKTGSVPVMPSQEPSTAMLLHNEIQTSLYTALVAKYGKQCVGTENTTGDGTSIDVVVKSKDFCWFYEIKTDSSVKACIRQALPQLLEYAYWHGKDDRADRLVVVSPLRVTREAEAYLQFLRKTFGLEIYYEQHSVPGSGREKKGKSDKEKPIATPANRSTASS